jgi:thioredoxin reductase (NADPH)
MLTSTNKAQPEAGSAVADRLTRWRAATVPIIGGGPAGMSCALWLHNYGCVRSSSSRSRALGGMARRSPYQHDWLLGRPDQSARDNAARSPAASACIAKPFKMGIRNYVRNECK